MRPNGSLMRPCCLVNGMSIPSCDALMFSKRGLKVNEIGQSSKSGFPVQTTGIEILMYIVRCKDFRHSIHESSFHCTWRVSRIMDIVENLFEIR
jgi:hypothetical protein